MRIGMVCPYSFDHPGGVQAHILDLAEVFISQGHEVAVLGPGTDPSEVPDYVTLGGGTVPLSYNGSVARIAFGPKTFRVVRDFLRAGDFDVLHLHEPNAPSYSLAALIVARGPVVATYHASAVSSTLLKLARPFLRPALEKIDAGISVSEMSRRWQVEQLGGDPLLSPNGVESARFRDAQRHSDSGPVNIVFLGRLDEPRKGLDVFLDAVARLRAMVNCDFRVTVVGGGTHREVPGVDFAGRVTEEEKAQILGEADIYVAPNTGGESFGIVLVEAMAAGCAVVASGIEAFAAVCDTESDTPAGLLFPVGDSDALAATLAGLIQDPSARAQLARAGQARALRYDWDVVSREVMEVYETVMGGQSWNH